ncbi:MAG: 16S rRNA (cytosine(1402)-N(4))-methyltransferase RsmH, partial [Candidatus Puniceispirillaceae bacterium]
MTESSLHIPVMLDEVITALMPAAGKVFIDATFGNGGYSRALLESADCRVAAIDRDPDAILRGQPMLQGYQGRFSLLEGNFSQIARLCADAGIDRADGIVFDLGVCSTQLDQAERGFSFRADGPLDMRMSQQGRDASDIVNELDEAELADIIWRFGEERASRRIARAIVRARLDARIERTGQLADIIHSVMPRPKPGQADSATRTFQALRIYINGELDELKTALADCEKLLAPDGILAIVSFHSLEDRIVKNFLNLKSGNIPAPSRHRPEIAPP